MANEHDKNIEIDRMVFFSDAVVAIAITLLALDLKLDHISMPMSFSDIGGMWRKFGSFFLSFILISVFWKVHHQFFRYIRHTDETLMNNNLMWLLFIITLPFSTTLVSERFHENVPLFVYAMNIFMITTFQNSIWDYASARPHLMKENMPKEVVREYRIDCNVAVVNAVIAVILSLFSPLSAFIVLFLRPVMMVMVKRYYGFPRPDRGSR